jgi:hypothetical protein
VLSPDNTLVIARLDRAIQILTPHIDPSNQDSTYEEPCGLAAGFLT